MKRNGWSDKGLTIYVSRSRGSFGAVATGKESNDVQLKFGDQGEVFF